MTKKPKLNLNNNLCLSSVRENEILNTKNLSSTHRNRNLKTSFSPISNLILSQSILNSFKLPKYKKKITLYPKIGINKINIIHEITNLKNYNPKDNINNDNNNNENNKNNNNNSYNNNNIQNDYLHTSINFHNRFFSNPKISFENNHNNKKYENNKTEVNSLKKFLNSNSKIILRTPSKETTLNTNCNINIIKDDIINFETPEDFHIFNVNVIQKGKKLAFKFENIENSKIEIKKIGDEF